MPLQEFLHTSALARSSWFSFCNCYGRETPASSGISFYWLDALSVMNATNSFKALKETQSNDAIYGNHPLASSFLYPIMASLVK